MTDQNEIQKNIIDELGLSGLPEEKKKELSEKMTEVVLKRIFIETMYRLSEEDQAGYEKMIDENAGPEEVEKFLREKIPNYDDMIKKILEDFKEEMKKV